MAAALPEYLFVDFCRRLAGEVEGELSPEILRRLWLHYQELRRWSPRLSLVGPGTARDVLRRHYAESLAALPLLDSGNRVVDLGSGAGFPGWILAAARPDLDVLLVEARHKKAVFLESAIRKASLSCAVLNARVGASLPEGFPDVVDLVTLRALRIEPEQWEALKGRLSKEGRIVRWVGPGAPPGPAGFESGRRLAIAGSERMVEELLRSD